MRRAPILLALALAPTLIACDAKAPDSKDASAVAKTEPPPAEQPKPEVSEPPPAEQPKPEVSEPEAPAAAPAQTPNELVLDHSVKLLDGSDKSLADYRGKALLVVNTASECGLTPQYAGLQALHAKYADKGLEVLAFPSNDFGGQEPGSAEDIRAFVDSEFSVEFEMFDKVVVKGPDKVPLYQALTEGSGEGIKGEIQWNFTKFLVDPEGRVVRRFEPPIEPSDPELIAAIEAVLPAAS